VFEGGLEAWVGALISVLAALKLQSLVASSSEFDPYREGSRRDAAMWVIVQLNMPKALK
jgi:hypothetical protein